MSVNWKKSTLWVPHGDDVDARAAAGDLTLLDLPTQKRPALYS